MSTATDTTIVIATRDRERELLRTLGAHARSHPGTPVVVVDNGSAVPLAPAVHREFPDVRVLTSPRNLGPVARNFGVRHAGTTYVAFSDDDSWWAPGALAAAEDVLDAHPHLALVAATTLVGPEERPDPVVAEMARSPLRGAHPVPGPALLGFTACSAVVRREAFAAVGGFSPLLFFVGEEKLLSYDLAAAGWDLAFVASVVAHHHPSPHRQSSHRRDATERRNGVLISWLRRPLRTAAAESVRLLRDAVRDPVARAALPGALRRLPEALARRQRLPRRVEAAVRLLGH
ncbi:glycosyltransferase family 2 protein [Saccharopolyspora sp. 6M]|uniref:glycosyltransferase family 2 protein n=1 Tax=Saccharopolyspora sp. 6M TaxID=2877237 RepID=UPI001CD7205C|nr:glycosyltransferase [Saccharopolyspora sp. 6M]MCA1225845.1 glycosyltransferase [Saccharopolyspora sp. 6M]